MIPRAYITEWTATAPWKSMDQVEQDLIICRSLVELFSDNFLAENLAFRGGTAIHKLYLRPQSRYSEDIDLVQTVAGPFGPIADRIQERLSFLGAPRKNQKENNFTLVYRFATEFEPVKMMKLKIETNCREHDSVLGLKKFPFQVDSSWFKGSAEITTYELEELAATKLRALYQRSKGRDLYDLYKILNSDRKVDLPELIAVYRKYMVQLNQPPTAKIFLRNLEQKMDDPDFFRDTDAILSPVETYDPDDAYSSVEFMITKYLK